MLGKFVALVAGAALTVSAFADESWSGIVKQEPQGDNVHWLIGDNELTMNENTRIKVSVGRLEVGACAQVDADGQAIEKVTTRPMSRCDDTDYDAYFEMFRSLAAKES